jgi:hypothetical protein
MVDFEGSPIGSTGNTKAVMAANVRFKLAEVSTVRVTNDRVNWALESGYRRVSRRLKLHSTGTPLTANSAASQYYYLLSAFAGGGSRIYHITGVWYDDEPLYPVAFDKLRETVPKWPVDCSGTPTHYAVPDSRKILLYKTPTAVKAIAIAGYLTPDTASWEDDDVPDMHEDFAEIVEHYACAVLTTNILDENASQFRNSYFGALYVDAITEAIGARGELGGSIPRIGTGNTVSVGDDPTISIL